MSFFSSVKNMFTKRPTRKEKEKEKDIEMLGTVKPVYTRKVIGVSPKRNHRVMNSPPLRNKTIRRGMRRLTPIQSMSESKSSSRRRLPALKIPSSSTHYSISSTKSNTRSHPKSRSNNSFYISSPSSKSRSRSKSKTTSSSSRVNTRRRIPRRKKRRPPTYEKRRIYRQRIKSSRCRGIKPGTKCKLRRSCKYAMGEKRQFCRKRKNTKIR